MSQGQMYLSQVSLGQMPDVKMSLCQMSSGQKVFENRERYMEKGNKETDMKATKTFEPALLNFKQK